MGSRQKPRGDGEWPCDVVRLRVKGKEGGPLTDWGREAVGRPPGAGTAESSLKTGEFPKRECIGWWGGWLQGQPDQRPQDGELSGVGLLEGWVWDRAEGTHSLKPGVGARAGPDRAVTWSAERCLVRSIVWGEVGVGSWGSWVP